MKKILTMGFASAAALTTLAAVRTVSIADVRGDRIIAAFGPAAGGETNALVMAWGAADGGETPDAWANSKLIGLVLPQDAEKSVKVPDGWGAADATKLRLFLCDGYSPNAYATDGLLTRWDAIDNVGTGVHDAEAKVWKDLAGDTDLTLTNNATWADGKALNVSNLSAYASQPVPMYETLEIVTSGTMPKNAGQLVFSSGINPAQYGRANSALLLVAHVRGALQLNGDHSFVTPVRQDDSLLCCAGVFENNIATRLWTDGYEDEFPTFINDSWGYKTPNATIGEREFPGNYPWIGKLHTIRLYGRKLTEEELANNHVRDMVRFAGFPETASATAASPLVTFTPAVKVLQTIYNGSGAPTAVEVAFSGVTGPTELTAAWDATDKGTNPSAWATHKIVYVVRPEAQTRVIDLPSGWGKTVNALRFFLRTGITAASYVTSGLITRWDALDNAGTGSHDASATQWKDLVGSNHLTLIHGATWNKAGDGLVVTGISSACSTKATADYRTAEAVFTPSSLTGNVMFHAGTKSGQQINRAFVFDNLGRTAYTDGSRETYYANTMCRIGERTTLASTCSDVGAATGMMTRGEPSGRGCHQNNWGSLTNVTIIGARSLTTTQYAWCGDVHAIRLYNRELSKDELLTNYRCDLVRYFGVTPQAPTVAATSAVYTYGGTKGAGDPALPETKTDVAESGIVMVDMRTGVRTAVKQREILPLTWSTNYFEKALDYVKDGLIGHWDGLDNAGTGVHDTTATKWKDLAGNADMALLSGGGWNERGIVCSGPAAQAAAAAPNYRTIETAFKITKRDSRIMFTSGYTSRFQIFDWIKDNPNVREYFDGSKTTLISKHPPAVGSLTLSAAVYNGSDTVTAIYTNGVKDVSGETNQNTWGTGDGKMMVGDRAKAGSTYKWYGEIYAIRLYSRALNDAEIAANRLVDFWRYGEDRRIISLPDGLTVRATCVGMEGTGEDLTKWTEKAGTAKTLQLDETGTIRWVPERGVWKLKLEFYNGDLVLQSETALFDLRGLALGMTILLR